MTKVTRKTWQGIVRRKAGEMTVVVEVQEERWIKLYDKKKKRHRRFMVHDPHSEAQIGERVVFVECRPISKRKKWIIVKRLIGNRK